MRFPALSDLDREQRKIYGEAPADGAILVVGPPGTGKTVMAFHRAQKLKKLGQEPAVIMFNKVLVEYTSAGSQKAQKIESKTMNKWAYVWWRKATKKSKLPSHDGNPFDINWTVIGSEGIALIQGDQKAKVFDWGHLIIDEGQDFPPDMYTALGFMQRLLTAKGVSCQLTVFADDNQRLNADKNSRIKDIRSHLSISGDPSRNYVLRKNFRNSRPIAKFAAHFQVGNESGVPEFPDRAGELPEVAFAASDRDTAEFIIRKAKTSGGKQVGVLVFGQKKHVKRTFNQLKARVGEKEKAIRVQAYVSNDEEHCAENLNFEAGNTITIVHTQSAKGLEFDVVFIVGMERLSLDSSGFENERMALYVMCSRARSELYVVFSDIDEAEELPAAVRLLPMPSAKLCRYSGIGELADVSKSLEKRIEEAVAQPAEGAS